MRKFSCLAPVREVIIKGQAILILLYHSYNKKVAMEIVTWTKEKFYDLFCELKSEIDQKWKD